MVGDPTILGHTPVRYVSPPSEEAVKNLLIGTQRYFDYGNIDNLRKMVKMFFENGYPFESPLSGDLTSLNDLRTMRNSSAHISSTTQRGLEALAQRIFSVPQNGINLYTMLITPDPRSPTGGTVFSD